MKQSRFFEVPDDLETKIRLLFAAPAGWVFSVSLEAPLSMVDNGQVLIRHGLYYDGHMHRELQMYDSERGTCQTARMDYPGIILERKPFQFVTFSQLGLCKASLTRIQGEQIASVLIRHGFRGQFSFHSGYYDDDMATGEHAGEYEVALQPWTMSGSVWDESGLQPARVRIDWKKAYGGSEEFVRPLVLACQELGLREYVSKGYAQKQKAA